MTQSRREARHASGCVGLFLWVGRLQDIGTVKRVALCGQKAGVVDDPPKFFFVGAALHACRENDIFLDQDAADVVSPELQADLAYLDPRREPARLDVVNVVEVNAADGQCLQIVDSGCFLNFPTERCIFCREYPRDECGEPAGLFLKLTNPFEMINAMAQLFTSTEHHLRGRSQDECMRRAMNLDPVVAGALQAGDASANFVVQNLRAASGDRLQARIHQALDGVTDT